LLAGAFSAMTPRKATKIPPPQWLFLAIAVAFFILSASTCHAGQVPRAKQEEQLPPPKYDRPYEGDLYIARRSDHYIGAICKHALRKGQKTALGCAVRFEGPSCAIWIAKDEDLKWWGYDYDIVFRHERGHCHEWLH
jgi:hypothetical protein